jgi:hypothetical protein
MADNEEVRAAWAARIAARHAASAARDVLKEAHYAEQRAEGLVRAVPGSAAAKHALQEAKAALKDARRRSKEFKTAETTAVDMFQTTKSARSAAVAAEAARVHPCSLPGCTTPAPYMCARCRSAYYCSQEHQKADWNRHKRECRALSTKAGGRRKSRRSKRSKRSHRKTKRRHH